MVLTYPIVGRLPGLACVAVDRPDGFHPVLSFVLSCPVLSCPSLRYLFPLKLPLMQYKTRTHEAGCAGNGQKITKRELLEVEV